MHKVAAIAVPMAAMAVLALSGGEAMAGGGSSGTWPSGLPLPTHPGRLVAQSSDTPWSGPPTRCSSSSASSTNRYVTQKDCARRLAVNKPRDYLCRNRATGKTDEIVFTFAALDPTARHPARSQQRLLLPGLSRR